MNHRIKRAISPLLLLLLAIHAVACGETPAVRISIPLLNTDVQF